MASNAFVSEIIGLLSFLALLCISDSSKVTPDKFFDVRRYSAVSDGKTDNSQVRKMRSRLAYHIFQK